MEELLQDKVKWEMDAVTRLVYPLHLYQMV